MSEYRKSIKENKDGLTTQEIQNQLTLGKETEAKMDVQILQQPAIDPWNSEKSGIDGNYGYHLAYNSSVNGAFAKVTYTNLKNSYYVDADGNKHQIIKIVRTFSDLTRSTSTASINWTKERASYEGTTSDNAEKTILSISSIPTNGAMFFNASGVTVSDLYYDKDGNRLSVKDGYIVMSSLNNNGKGDVESAKGLSGQTPKTFIGSSVYVQSDGSLQANGDNSYYLHDSTHSEYNNWDNANSDKFYWGAGLLKINNDGANVIRFNVSNALGNNPEDALNSYWFTISTILPTTANPTSSINYHYNVANITPGVPDKDNVSYQYHNLNVATTPEKNWTQGSQTVNGKTEINDDVVSATVKMTTPAASQVEGGMKTLAVTDNYSKFASNVTYQGAQVYENDQLATSLYNVTNNAADATVTATRKDASTTQAGTVSLVVDFKINSDVPSGTKFENSGSGTINNSTVPTNDAEIVTYEQSAKKHWIEGTQTVDGKTYINDDVVTTKVDMSLPDPATLAHSLTNVTIDDDYSDTLTSKTR